MSKFVAYCPSCQKKYKIDISLLGRILKCKECETLFEIAKPPETVLPTTPRPAPPPSVLPASPAVSDRVAPDPLALDPLAPDPLAPDPLAMDPLAPDPLTIDPLATDPLAAPVPAKASRPMLAGRPATAATPAAAGWKQAVAVQKEQGLLGGSDRALLMLGGFLLIFGITMNLLPLFGMQVARFQGTGKTGQIVGLLMGLAGAGLLAASLRRFRLAAIVGGSAGSGLLLVVFLVSLLAGRESVNPDLTGGGPVGDDRLAYDIDNVKSPWIASYPNWEGFTSAVRPASAISRWTRVPGVEGVSASFPGTLQAGRESISVGGQNVVTRIIRCNAGQQVLELAVFEHPDASADESSVLDAVEASMPGLAKSRPLTVESFPAREYSLRNTAKGSQQGVVVVAGSTVIHASVSGPANLVPGEFSQKFLASLHIEPGVATGTVASGQASADALDPFTFESNGDQASPKLPAAASPGPNLVLSPADRQHDQKVRDHIMAIKRAMEEHINLRIQNNFNLKYRSVSAGEETGKPQYVVHPGKVPVTGIDFVLARTPEGEVFTSIAPVYDTANTSCVVQARPGFGLSGLRVNARDQVRGIKFVFSKITDRGFDLSQSYESDWYGTPASGSGQPIDSGGRPVYGLWISGRNVVTSVGLIREK